MKLIEKPISKKDVKEMAVKSFGSFVKAVVDIKKEIMAVDAPLHADEEAHLLSLGSQQENIWGINIYPDFHGPDFVEFDSMINLRPQQENISRGIDNPRIKQSVYAVVQKLIPDYATP